MKLMVKVKLRRNFDVSVIQIKSKGMFEKMILVYENEIGRVEMRGGGRGPWRITGVTGTGLPPKSYGVITFAGQDGQEVFSQSLGARTITVSGDIQNNNEMHGHIKNAHRIFNLPGLLKLFLFDKQRKISCRVNAFELGERNGAAQPFVLQFIADRPAFEALENTMTAVMSSENMVSYANYLPMELTRATSGANVINAGDIKTEPVFYIRCLGGNSSEGGVEITNTSTGQFIKLLYSMTAEEEIIVDIPRRRIESSLNGSIISHISTDTFLNKFRLEPGINRIEAKSLDPGQGLSVICEFTSRYIEAVY